MERFRWLGFLMVFLPATGCSDAGEHSKHSGAPSDTIRVVEIRYFPVEGEKIDIGQTGDWGESLDFTRTRVDSISAVLRASLSEGSRYHGYRSAEAIPSLLYESVETYEYLEALPTFGKPDRDKPMTDYDAIMKRIGAREWVESQGVQEFWIWGYHGGVLDLWESNMSGPHGDISNSDRITSDLPVFGSTYTVYHYNYQRGVAEAMENHMHQLEAVLNHFDGRDATAYRDWPELLFWGKFVGSDSTHTLASPIRAGWSHFPPNATTDYDWANSDSVLTDIEDWTPYGTGKSEWMNCERWKCDHLDWFVYWTQNIPGRLNDLSYRGRPLRNWWRFISDVDSAFEEDWRLWE